MDVHVHHEADLVSAGRERLSDALDEAQRGIPVIIARKGVRYRLTVEKATPSRSAAAADRSARSRGGDRRMAWDWSR